MNPFKKFTIGLFLVVISFSILDLKAQKPSSYSPDDFASSISAGALNMYLSVLAGDAMEGRETGTSGNDQAAHFIASQLQSFGVPPIPGTDTYFQQISFTKTDWEKVHLNIGDQTYRHLWDFVCLKNYRSIQDSFSTSEVIFLGFGIDDPAYSDYVMDVRGKVILIYDGEPVNKKGIYWVSGTAEASDWNENWMRKLKVAREKGAAGVLFIPRNFKGFSAQIRRFSMGPNLVVGLPGKAEWPSLALISSTVAEALMGEQRKAVIKSRDRVNKRGKSVKPVIINTDLTLVSRREDIITNSNNVLGYIQGTHPILKDELVVISAHYDHLGKRGDDIFNGADDNGSGTSTVLELARAYSLAKAKRSGPARSILMLFVTGEEKGLLGSKYYVENPIFPLEKTVANINIDMVGRTDEKYKDNPNYIYVIGSDRLSSTLHEITEQTNQDYVGLTLDYTYNDENDPNRYYYRSDHYNFAEKGIPAVFFFSGVHSDYHRPSDTVDKINFIRMAEVGKLAFHIAWELADRPERIKVDRPVETD